MPKLRVTPNHTACIEELKQFSIRWSAVIPPEELQMILALNIGYLAPVVTYSVEEMEDVVSENMALGIFNAYRGLKGT